MSVKVINFPYPFCFESRLKDQNNLLFSLYAGIKAKHWNNQTLDDDRLNVQKKIKKCTSTKLEVSKPSNPACQKSLHISGYFYLYDHN